MGMRRRFFRGPRTRATRPRLPRRDPRSTVRLPLACVLLSVLVGTFLRVWRAGSPLLFQDELFAVAAAADLRYTCILTHFGFFDHCIPLSLYAKLLTATVGPDEWTLRLPGMGAVIAALFLVAVIGWRVLDRVASVLL